MKTKYKLFSVMLAVCLIFPAFASYVGAYSETQQCLHNTLYDFDNETMTVKGVYEGNRIEAFSQTYASIPMQKILLLFCKMASRLLKGFSRKE